MVTYAIKEAGTVTYLILEVPGRLLAIIKLMSAGLQARMEIVRMPLKKKDRDRLFEKDLEKGEN
jgi:hypothetical protein